MSAQETPRHTLKKEVQLLLGDQMIEVELDDEHLNLAVKLAIEKIRQRTTGGVEESHVFFTMQPDQNIYTMPEEVVEVEKLFRRGVGATSTGGTRKG